MIAFCSVKGDNKQNVSKAVCYSTKSLQVAPKLQSMKLYKSTVSTGSYCTSYVIQHCT